MHWLDSKCTRASHTPQSRSSPGGSRCTRCRKSRWSGRRCTPPPAAPASRHACTHGSAAGWHSSSGGRRWWCSTRMLLPHGAPHHKRRTRHTQHSSAHLLVGVLGALGAQEGHRHEVVVPGDVAAGGMRSMSIVVEQGSYEAGSGAAPRGGQRRRHLQPAIARTHSITRLTPISGRGRRGLRRQAPCRQVLQSPAVLCPPPVTTAASIQGSSRAACAAASTRQW